MKSEAAGEKLTVQRIAMLETHPQKMLQDSKNMLFQPGRHGISCIEGLRSSVRQSNSVKSIAAGCSKLFGLRAVI
jgi:hypothetical protein